MSRTGELSGLPVGEWQRAVEADLDDIDKRAASIEETVKWMMRTLIGLLVAISLAAVGLALNLVVK